MLRVLGGLISQSEDLRVESEELSTLFLYTRKRERVEKISTLNLL